ncbi:MAG TPA: hypothetical protein EYP00_01175 [Dehalococcoidia bacterium]|nr:hypothetical protein [Dehalococcoidia bacterium]
MLVFVSIIICIIPAMVVLYPLLSKIASQSPFPEDESSVNADLERRWESALDGLQSAELERSLGNLDEEDYRWLREIHMYEAALVLKAMDLSKSEEISLMKRVNDEIAKARVHSGGVE